MGTFILLAPAYSFSVKTASGTAINENPIVFDEVRLNIGEAYDNTTGKFRKHIKFHIYMYHTSKLNLKLLIFLSVF